MTQFRSAFACAGLIVLILLVALGNAAPAAASIDMSGHYVAVEYPCEWTFVQTGTDLQATGSCSVGPVSLSGTIDPVTGVFTVTGEITGACTNLVISATADGEMFTGTYTSSGCGSGPATGTKCLNGVIDPGEDCQDGNVADGDCCSSRCRRDPPGSACRSDRSTCTDDVCDAAGLCSHEPNAFPCEDGNACTAGDACAGGTCVSGAPLDGNACAQAERCRALKMRSAGNVTRALLRCHPTAGAHGTTVSALCLTRGSQRLANTFTHIENRFGCATTGDAAVIQLKIDAFVAEVTARLWPTFAKSGCSATKLRATGIAVQSMLRTWATAPADNTLLITRLTARRNALFAAFNKAEDKGGCGTNVDAVRTQAFADRLVADVVAGLVGRAVFPACDLRHVAQLAGVNVGAALAPAQIAAEPFYADTATREFNALTPENVMKWGPIEPNPGVWNFAPADALVDFAIANGMRVKGHTLVWHSQLPSYINSLVSAPALHSYMEEHITALVGRYRDRVYAWDVVNEAVADDGSGLRPTYFLNQLGPGYIADAFRIAHAADPHALLVYNDYNAEFLNSKSDYIYAMVQQLLADGVPIHGVGLQMHLTADGNPINQANLAANIQRFVDLGLVVNISEMDVGIRELTGDPASKLDQQRQIYEDVIAVCRAIAGCHAVTFWGFTDKYSWIDFTFGPDDPLLFDESYNPKPAYYGVRDAFFNSGPFVCAAP